MLWIFLEALCLVMIMMECSIWKARQDGTRESQTDNKSLTINEGDTHKGKYPIDGVELVDNPIMTVGNAVDKREEVLASRKLHLTQKSKVQ